MKVNDLVKTIGYTRNRLDHFEFNLYAPYNDDWILIKNPTADDYIFLCDREIQEWMIEDSNNIMSVIILMIPEDREIFKKYIKE